MTYTEMFTYVSGAFTVVGAIATVVGLFLMSGANRSVVTNVGHDGQATVGEVVGASNALTIGHGNQVNIGSSGPSAREMEQRRQQGLISLYARAWINANDGVTSDELAGVLSQRQIDYINERLKQTGEIFRLQ
jgi:hypothetical protein